MPIILSSSPDAVDRAVNRLRTALGLIHTPPSLLLHQVLSDLGATLTTEPAPWYSDHEKLALTAEFMARQQSDLPPAEVLSNVLYLLEKPHKHDDDFNLAQAEQEIQDA